MTTATIRKAHERFPDRPICVGSGATAIWSEVWEGLPVSKTIEPNAVWIHDYGKHRPYIDYEKSTNERFHYRPDFRVEPGWIELSKSELFFSRAETQGEPYVYIEPTVKGSFSGNKDWGFANWQEVTDTLKGVRFVQGKGRRLFEVEQVETETIRDAFALLSGAKLFVGTDGALHHAAAALGIPAVVVWGGLASPTNLGYGTHTNLWSGVPPCGSHKECTHCRMALASIRPRRVIDAIETLC